MKVDARDLGGHTRQAEPQQLDGARGARLDGEHHPRERGAEHRFHVAVVADEAQLGVERHVLGEVPRGVVRLGPKDRSGLVDASNTPTMICLYSWGLWARKARRPK